MKRVVITGLGPLTALGKKKDSFYESLLAGKSGIEKIDKFDVSEYSCQIASTIKEFNPASYMNKKAAKRMDKFSQYAVAAAKIAIEDASLDINEKNQFQVGVVVGSGIGGLLTLENQHKVLLSKGPSRISPFLIPMMISNMASGNVSLAFKARGYNTCSVTACASGNNSIGEAYEAIKRGQAKAMIAGGSEVAVTPLGLAGFCSLKALSTKFNNEPHKASRPFDFKRDGFVMSDGAGVLILEEREYATQRGAKIYAEIVGYGATADAFHITAPNPSAESPAMAIKQALAENNVKPEEVDYINAHGTSTVYNDKVETKAIKKVFGKRAYKIPISSTKSMTGHLLGAAGAVEAIVCALAIDRGKIPPTINYENPDPNCDLDYTPNEAREVNIKTALSNSLGFGGHNAILAFRKHV